MPLHAEEESMEYNNMEIKSEVSHYLVRKIYASVLLFIYIRILYEKSLFFN